MGSLFSPQLVLILKLQSFSQPAHSVNKLKARTRKRLWSLSAAKAGCSSSSLCWEGGVGAAPATSPVPRRSQAFPFPARPFPRAPSAQVAPRISWVRGCLRQSDVFTFNSISLYFFFLSMWMGDFLDPLRTFGTSKQDVPLFNYLLHEDPPLSVCFESATC